MPKSTKIKTKILHIIPSSFDCFDFVLAPAFRLVNTLNSVGIESESITFEYGKDAPKKYTADKIKKISPGVKPKNVLKHDDFFESLNKFDLIHIHAPILGKINHFISWKKNHPEIPLLITYYGHIKSKDLFDYYVKIYNQINMPRLFKIADVVTCFGVLDLKRSWWKKSWIESGKLYQLYDYDKFLSLTEKGEDDKIVQIEMMNNSILNLLEIYKKIIIKTYGQE